MVQVGELFGWEADEGVLLLGVGSSEKLVEDVEVTLSLSLVNDSGLLEQVDLKAGSGNETRSVELESDEFTETRRVVVLVRLGITKGFEHRVKLNQLVFKGSLLSSATTGDVGDVLNDLLGVFSLTSTRLSAVFKKKKKKKVSLLFVCSFKANNNIRNEERLVLAVVQHGTVGTIGDGEDVRRDLITSLTTVGVDHEVSVDGDLLVGVDDNTEKSGVGLEERDS